MVKVSDGKTRPSPMRLHLSMELLKLQKEEISPVNRNHHHRSSPTDSRVWTHYHQVDLPKILLYKNIYDIYTDFHIVLVYFKGHSIYT